MHVTSQASPSLKWRGTSTQSCKTNFLVCVCVPCFSLGMQNKSCLFIRLSVHCGLDHGLVLHHLPLSWHSTLPQAWPVTLADPIYLFIQINCVLIWITGNQQQPQFLHCFFLLFCVYVFFSFFLSCWVNNCMFTCWSVWCEGTAAFIQVTVRWTASWCEKICWFWGLALN